MYPCLAVWTMVLPKSTSVHLFVLQLLVLLFPSVQFRSSGNCSGVIYACSSVLLLSGLAGPKRGTKSLNFGCKQGTLKKVPGLELGGLTFWSQNSCFQEFLLSVFGQCLFSVQVNLLGKTVKKQPNKTFLKLNLNTRVKQSFEITNCLQIQHYQMVFSQEDVRSLVSLRLCLSPHCSPVCVGPVPPASSLSA